MRSGWWCGNMEETRKSAEEFLHLIRKSRKGKLKVYIGMSAGVGKTYRMLLEAHSLLKNGIDIKIGFVETHGREETQALLAGLPVIPLYKTFYKGKALEEMDLEAILNLRPEVVIVDELAHSNIHGSKNEKRWQDVMEIINSGINVITAINIQHLESLNEEIRRITGVEVKERVPDKLLAEADEVVNIDLTAQELIGRLKEGKIYKEEKIETALKNFFQSEHILQLRELALKEVASQVERKVESEIKSQNVLKHERFLACISSNEVAARTVIRKSARLANYYQSKWFVLYVQTKKENAYRIPLDKQRHLINNLKLATELGAEIIRVESSTVSGAILEQAELRKITTICIGKPHFSWFTFFSATRFINGLSQNLAERHIDLIILS